MKLIVSLDRAEDGLWIAECSSIPGCLPHVLGGVSARGISSSWNSGRAPVGKMGWAYRQPARTVRCFTNSGWLPLEPCSGSGSFEYSRRKRVKVVFRFQIARPIGRRSPTPARRFDSLLYGLCLRWRKRRPVRGDRPPPAAQCVWGEQAGRGTGHSICRR